MTNLEAIKNRKSRRAYLNTEIDSKRINKEIVM